MVESAKFADAAVGKIEETHVVMAVGVGDRNVCNILFGRKPFVKAAADPETAKEIKILRVDVANEDELNDLKLRVMEAKGELDPGVEHGVKREAKKEEAQDLASDSDTEASTDVEAKKPPAKPRSGTRGRSKAKSSGKAKSRAAAEAEVKEDADEDVNDDEDKSDSE